MAALLLRSLLAAAALGVVLRPMRGEVNAAAVSPPAGLTPEQKASLALLDRALDRFDALLARDDDARHQAATRAVLDRLKHRRDALRAAFDSSKYDDLRTELALEYHRLAAWMAPPLNPAPPGPGSP